MRISPRFAQRPALLTALLVLAVVLCGAPNAFASAPPQQRYKKGDARRLYREAADHYVSKRPQQAIELIQVVLSLGPDLNHPDFQNLYKTLGHAYYALDHYPEAADAYLRQSRLTAGRNTLNWPCVTRPTA